MIAAAMPPMSHTFIDPLRGVGVSAGDESGSVAAAGTDNGGEAFARVGEAMALGIGAAASASGEGIVIRSPQWGHLPRRLACDSDALIVFSQFGHGNFSTTTPFSEGQ